MELRGVAVGQRVFFLHWDSGVLRKELDEKSQGDKHNVATVKRSAPKSTPGSLKQCIPAKKNLLLRTP